MRRYDIFLCKISMKEKFTASSTILGSTVERRDDSPLVIDSSPLEGQLEKACEVLDGLSRRYSFDSLSHFKVLADLVEAADGDTEQAVKLLDQWPYASITFIERHLAGNCVDFAIRAQASLHEAGVPTMIIGKLPEATEFTASQIAYMRYRHVSLLYANDSSGSVAYSMFEPGWKFPHPIDLSLDVSSGGDDWKFETKMMDQERLVQQTYNVRKKKFGERVFDMCPMSLNSCQALTKRLTRIPRKMEKLNRLTNDEPTVAVRFDPNTKLFSTTVQGVSKDFVPGALKDDEERLLASAFELPDIRSYLESVRNLSYRLPENFWIK